MKFPQWTRGTVLTLIAFLDVVFSLEFGDHGGQTGRTCFHHGDRHYSHGRGLCWSRGNLTWLGFYIRTSDFCVKSTLPLLDEGPIAPMVFALLI